MGNPPSQTARLDGANPRRAGLLPKLGMCNNSRMEILQPARQAAKRPRAGRNDRPQGGKGGQPPGSKRTGGEADRGRAQGGKGGRAKRARKSERSEANRGGGKRGGGGNPPPGGGPPPFAPSDAPRGGTSEARRRPARNRNRPDGNPMGTALAQNVWEPIGNPLGIAVRPRWAVSRMEPLGDCGSPSLGCFADGTPWGLRFTLAGLFRGCNPLGIAFRPRWAVSSLSFFCLFVTFLSVCPRREA